MSKKTTKNISKKGKVNTDSNIQVKRFKSLLKDFIEHADRNISSSKNNPAKILFGLILLIISVLIPLFLDRIILVISLVFVLCLLLTYLFYRFTLKKFFRAIIIVFFITIFLGSSYLIWSNREVPITVSTEKYKPSVQIINSKDTVYIKTSVPPTINIKNVYEQKASEPEGHIDYLSNKIENFGSLTNLYDYMNKDKFSVANYSPSFNPVSATSLIDSTILNSMTFNSILNADSILHPERFRKFSIDKPSWLSDEIKIGNYTPTSLIVKDIGDPNFYDAIYRLTGVHSEEIKSDLKEYSYCLGIRLDSRDFTIGDDYVYTLTFSGDIDHFDFDKLATYFKSTFGKPHSYIITVDATEKRAGILPKSIVPELYIKAYSREKVTLIN